MHRKIRLLIADNHMLVAEACRHMLQPEFEVVDLVTDGRALVRAALALKPDIAILEIALPQLNGLDAARQIKRKSAYIRLIITAASLESDVAVEAFRRGASAYVSKQSRSDELITAIRRVMHGKSYLSSLIARETVDCLLQQQNNNLSEKRITPRQTEILQLTVEGKTMKEIGETLSISPRTVAFHKYTMMERLGIETNVGLLRFAIGNHITPAPGSWAVIDRAGTKLVDTSNEVTRSRKAWANAAGRT